MYRSLLLLLASVVPLATAITYNTQQHVFCGTASILPTDAAKFGSTAVSSGGCRTLCNNNGYTWDYFSSTINTTPTCYCSNLSPVEAGVTASVNTAGACANAVYAVNRVTTTYTWQGCYLAPPQDSINPYNGPDVNQCIKSCAYQQWIGIYPDTSGNYECFCGPNPPTTAAVTCQKSRYHTLSHPMDATVSGFTKRNLKQRLEMAKRGKVCPGKLAACLVGGGSTDFECIDTETELESCGGCSYGSYKGMVEGTGVDCTSLPGVLHNAVACDQGKCVATRCQKGYKLEGGACKPKRLTVQT